MGYAELVKWEKAFLDVGCVRLMLYLAKCNPNKQINELEKSLQMTVKEINQKIKMLIEANMLTVNDAGQFTLKDSALIGLNNFLELARR